MSQQLRARILAELESIALIDPHTHINPHAPAATTLADILGYHYYTELAHSAGLPKAEIEAPGLEPKEQVFRIVGKLPALENTVQYSWLIALARSFFGFNDHVVNQENWEQLYDAAAKKMAQPDWADQVLWASKLDAVFLTNNFDDPLEGFDTKRYIPCLRTDELVFQIAKATVRSRLADSTGIEPTGIDSLIDAIGVLFTRFTGKGAKACAISLPPDFSPQPVDSVAADSALQRLLRDGEDADDDTRRTVANFVFWQLATFCNEYRLPLDLMIGVNRGVYAEGVVQGQDLYDSRVSLIQYRELFNAFPQVTFPISVLASVTNQELTSYAWIFPNVVTNGHWWYSNTPTFIEHDASARLEAVPSTKQIAYYSDMYKLEFALPKFAMYRRVLAKILAQRMVIDRGWTEHRAIELGRQVLRGNVERIFNV